MPKITGEKRSPSREAVRQGLKNCLHGYLKKRGQVILEHGNRVPKDLKLYGWSMRSLLDTVDDLVADGLVEVEVLNKERLSPYYQPQVRIKLKPTETAPEEVESGRTQ